MPRTTRVLQDPTVENRRYDGHYMALSIYGNDEQGRTESHEAEGGERDARPHAGREASRSGSCTGASETAEGNQSISASDASSAREISNGTVMSDDFREIERRRTRPIRTTSCHVLVAEGYRALLFSQFVDDRFGVDAAARALARFRPLTYTGATSREDRELVLQRFRESDQHKVLVLSVRAGGTGLNLQSASYVFHLDRWWNPAVEHQAEDRSHRTGQPYPVTVFKYTYSARSKSASLS
jgi:SNF2 family DNA or RNA helicase